MSNTTATATTAACRRERSTDCLIRAPIWSVDKSASAARSIEVLPLAPGEDAEQEAEADGDGNRGERVLLDRLFRLVGGIQRLVLGAVHLLVGDARDGRGQALDVGADRIDLASQFLRVWALGTRGHGGSFLL